jgi:hypothetical protein
MSGSTYINLLEPIIEYLYSEGYDIEVEDKRTYNRDFEFDPIDNNYLSNYVWPKGHALAGQPIILRDHQTEVTNVFLNNYQGIISAPTASGKCLDFHTYLDIEFDENSEFGKFLINFEKTNNDDK